jgi:hypothetical protein
MHRGNEIIWLSALNFLFSNETPDSTLALLSDGYTFISKLCQRYQFDIFETRLGGLRGGRGSSQNVLLILDSALRDISRFEKWRKLCESFPWVEL